MSVVKRELKVCRDCFIVAACGNEGLDSLDDYTHRLIIDAMSKLAKEGYVTTGDEEYGFEFSSCECCKRGYGGDRFQILVLE